MKFSIKYFLSKRDEIRLVTFRIWSHLLKKSFMENFIFCAAESLNEGQCFLRNIIDNIDQLEF